MSWFETAKPVLGFLTCAFCWGFAFIFINLGVSMEPALWMDVLWVVLTILLTLIMTRFLVRVRVKLTRRQSAFALLLGIPGTTLFMGLLSLAETSVAPGESSVLTYTYPIWVLLLSVPLLGEHLSPRKIAASLLGFGGVILIARIGTSGWSADLVPILELLGGSLGWSITNVAFKRLYTGEEIFTANLYQFGGAVIPLLLWAGLSEPVTAFRWSPTFLLVILCLAVFATTIPTIIWFSLVSRYNIATLATYSFLIPVVSLCASFFIFGERVDLFQGIGIVAVLSAIFAMNKSSTTKTRKDREQTGAQDASRRK